MIRKRNNGRAAAIGGLAATVALLTGFPAARPTNWRIFAPTRSCCSAASSSWLKLPRGDGPGGQGPTARSRRPGAMVGGSFPALVYYPGHRYLDPRRRVRRFDPRLLVRRRPAERHPDHDSSAATGQLELSTPLDVHGQTSRLSDPGKSGAGKVRHSRGNGVFSHEPAGNAPQCRDAHADRVGRVRGPLSSSTSPACRQLSRNNAQHGVEQLDRRVCGLPMARSAASSPGRPTRTSPTPTPTPRRSISAATAGQAGAESVSRRYATRIAGPWGSAWSVSLETPETDVVTPAGYGQNGYEHRQYIQCVNANRRLVANGLSLIGAKPRRPARYRSNPTKTRRRT